MGNDALPIEKKLASLLQQAKDMRDSFGKKLSAEPSLSHGYGPLLSRLRELGRGDFNAKDFSKAVGSPPMAIRQAIAFRGPSDGIGKIVMKLMPQLGLSKEDALLAALLCALEDAEQSFACLPDSKLPMEDQFMVSLCALQSHPVLDYEEYKTTEVMFQAANPDDPNESKEAQRKFEQVRGRRAQHSKKHLLKLIPQEIKKRASLYSAVLHVALKRDAFGSLDILREDAAGDSLSALSDEEKIGLLNAVANFGLGLASNNLDIFRIASEKGQKLDFQLQDIFRKDVVAGSNLLGVYAFEGIENYPFGLKRIEPVLPRKISSAEAQECLKRGELDLGSGPDKKPRGPSANDVADMLAQLQEREVHKFLEFIKWEIARNWKAKVGERKRDILFADAGLKVRNILFLIAYGLFDEEQVFENIFQFAQKSHPHWAEDAPKLLLMSNRYYFMDILGLNPGLLYNRVPRRNDTFGTLIQEVSDFQVHKLLHIGMSIYIKVSDTIFRNMSIAWNMLLGQCDGKIDQVFHEVGQLFDAIDTLLTIMQPTVSDLCGWSNRLLDALSEDSMEFPEESDSSPPTHPLRITTRAIISNTMDALNDYCVMALHLRAKSENVTPLNIIQVIKIDRFKSDKLRTLLQASSASQNRR
jgi:hypothetical protein